MNNISIFSYSFHRTLAAGKQDIFKFITDCKELGVNNIELWSGHFDDGSGQPSNYPPQDPAYIQKVKRAIVEPYFDNVAHTWRFSPFSIRGFDPMP